MKKIIFTSVMIVALLTGSFRFTYANCGGVLTPGLNAWTAASNCTVSNGLYSVWGVASINSRTITIATDAALIVDWGTDKMTFTTGKVLMSGNAVIYDFKQGNYKGYNDTTTGIAHPGGRTTNCDSGSAWNPITKSNATVRVEASVDGRIICK